MDPSVSFLKEGLLPEEKGEAEKIQRKTSRYWLSKEQKLYKCSYSGLYLLCPPRGYRTLVEGIT